MTLRSKTTTVRFNQPFALSGGDGPLPAGSYEVVTDEEQLEVMSAIAWRRVASTMLVSAGGVTQSIPLQSGELDALLWADAGGQGPSGPLPNAGAPPITTLVRGATR